ncbi:Gfo/Idh/MocA family oxidoreductase [Kiritimatiellota bacterium B12222]|nr:Gfo/Idh/MocA family oxidoreductase [Kiritimatiellota bacterium B12222]
MNKVKWGILGCGGIAHKFARSLAVVSTGDLVACASQTPGKAEAFAQCEKVPLFYDSYEALLVDSKVDAIYVATTHNFHVENVLLALAHGKAVLCEKPLGVNAEESQSMAAAANVKGLFLMEGMWTRFLPAHQQLKRWLDAGVIGEVQMLRANFCIQKPFEPEHRLYNPALAGGALLDVGVYPVSFASFVMGEAPERIAVLADMAPTGVDQTTLMSFAYARGAMAQLSCGITAASENRAEIVGTLGRIILPERFHGADTIERVMTDGHQEKLEYPYEDATGFRYEIEAVHVCLRQGQTHCALMPTSESVEIAQTMDRVRANFR